MYFPKRASQVSHLNMNTKTSKKLYYGELVRIERLHENTTEF
jgi:hypothetical protein